MMIRRALEADTCVLLNVERAAFGGQEEVDLVAALLGDPSATPRINLIAEAEGTVIGHVLFSHAAVNGDGGEFGASILAPLAVTPTAQRRGVGQALCREGILAAGKLGIGLIFVLGRPGYYAKFGFHPAQPLGLHAPYPIDPSVADAWMVLGTRPGLIGAVRGVVRCADALMQPELWAN